MRISRLALLFAFFVLAFGPASAFADGLIRDGIGAISMGRGGVNLGFADNGAVIFDNPAGMTNIQSTNLLDVGVDTVVCTLDYSDPDNLAADPSVNGYPLPMVGYVHRSPDSPWAFGFGAYAPAGFGSGYHLTNPDTGPTFYKSFGAMVKLLPSVAYQVNDRLSVGGTFGLAFSHTEIEGPYYLQTGPLAGTPTLLDLQTTGTAATGSVGLQYKVRPDTVLGLTYTEQTRFVSGGNARAQIGPLLSSFDATTTIVWPRSLGIGVKHDLCCCSRLGFDVVWYDWSSAYSNLPITLRDPSNPIVAGLIGPQLNDTFPLGWRDTVSYKFGYEWSPSDVLTCRFGYVYHNSPVSNATLTPLLDGILNHVLTAGISRQFGSTSLNLAYQYSWSPTRNVVDSAIVGDDFDNSSLRAEAHWVGVSVLTLY